MDDTLPEHKSINQACGACFLWCLLWFFSTDLFLATSCGLNVCRFVRKQKFCWSVCGQKHKPSGQPVKVSTSVLPQCLGSATFFYLISISGSLCYNLIKINLLIAECVVIIKMILQIPAPRIHSEYLQFVLFCFKVVVLQRKKEISFIRQSQSGLVWKRP